jgi:hypothetical protein
MAFEVVGIVALGFALTPDGDGWQLAPWLLIYGLGVGLATSQLAGIALSQVPMAQSGSASGAQSTARQLGAAIGTAILGATLLAGLGSTTAALTDRGVPEETAAEVTELMQNTAGTGLPSLADEPDGEVLVEGASEGFSTAIQLTSWVAALWVTVGLVATFLLPEVNPGRRRRERGPSASDGSSGDGDRTFEVATDADLDADAGTRTDEETAPPVATGIR